MEDGRCILSGIVIVLSDREEGRSRDEGLGGGKVHLARKHQIPLDRSQAVEGVNWELARGVGSFHP